VREPARQPPAFDDLPAKRRRDPADLLAPHATQSAVPNRG
jgi:hypothetical protein